MPAGALERLLVITSDTIGEGLHSCNLTLLISGHLQAVPKLLLLCTTMIELPLFEHDLVLLWQFLLSLSDPCSVKQQ